SSTERFILPCSSSKMRRSTTLSAIQRASSSESPWPTPRSTQRPCDTAPSTVTDASLTRWTTARTGTAYQTSAYQSWIQACSRLRGTRRKSIGAKPAFGGQRLMSHAEAVLRGRLPGVQRLEERGHVVGVLLFLLEHFLHQPPRGGIVVAEVADQL